MNAVALIREVMKMKDVSQAELANRIGGWTQSNITGILNNSKGNVRVGNLYQILNALDCEIVVKHLYGDEEWKLDFTPAEIEEMRPKSKKQNIDLDNPLK